MYSFLGALQSKALHYKRILAAFARKTQNIKRSLFYFPNSKNSPAAACKTEKINCTVFVGNLPKRQAPKNPPTVTPKAVGTTTEKSQNPRK